MPELVARSPRGPDHHLFDNHGTYWLRYSWREHRHLKPRRVARSLQTASLALARRRRDAILAALFGTYSQVAELTDRRAEPDKRCATSGSARRAGE